MLNRSIRSCLPLMRGEARRSAEVWARLSRPPKCLFSWASSHSGRSATLRSTGCARGGPVSGRTPLTTPPPPDSSNDRVGAAPRPNLPPPPPPGGTRRLPKILYIPNPIIWLTNKIDFSLLRYEWDPKFSEGEFRRGATQAVCTISQLAAAKETVELRGLLTRRALAQLELEIESQWAELQRRYIAIEPADVQIALPRRVHFRTAPHNDTSVAAERKLCDIDMVFIALKWIEAGTARAIVFIEIMARFHREYTQGVIPEWTVSAFKVSRFNIMPR